MSAPAFTPGPWEWHPCYDPTGKHLTSLDVCLPNAHSLSGVAVLASVWGNQEANARLIAAAPDHALICWAMCVQDGRWEEWVPFDGKGEFCFAGLKYATSIDEFGCPKLTPALRAAITQSQSVPE